MRGACNQSLQAVVSKLEQTLPNRVKLPFAHANSPRTSPNGFKRSFDDNQTVVGTVNPNWAARTHFFWVVAVLPPFNNTVLILVGLDLLNQGFCCTVIS